MAARDWNAAIEAAARLAEMHDHRGDVANAICELACRGHSASRNLFQAYQAGVRRALDFGRFPRSETA